MFLILSTAPHVRRRNPRNSSGERLWCRGLSGRRETPAPRRARRYRSRSLWPPPSNRTKRLGSFASANSRSPSANGTTRVARAVHDQQRRGNLGDPQVGAERILHQQTDRQKPIDPRADVGRRGERRLQHQAADLVRRGERNGDAAAERLAPRHDPFRRIARRGKGIDRLRVGDQPVLGRTAGRAAIAAIAQRDQTRPVGGQRPEAVGPQIAARRRCPGNRARPGARPSAGCARRSPSRRRRCRARSLRPAASRPRRAAVRCRSGKYISERCATYISATKPPKATSRPSSNFRPDMAQS